MPPAAPIDLPSNGTAVVLSDYFDARFAADQLQLQLAFAAVPAEGMGGWPCGQPPLVHGDLHDVTENELRSVVRELTSAGIPESDISAVMTHPATSPWKRKPLPVKLGEVLVTVNPMTPERLDDLLANVQTVRQQQPGLVVAGLAIRQRSCADRAHALAEARAKALSDARAFASRFGLRLKRAVTDRFELQGLLYDSAIACGDDLPALPYYPQRMIRDAAKNPQYHTHYAGRAVFSVSGTPHDANAPIARLREWSAVPPEPAYQQFTGALRVPPRVPFVSTFGSYRAVVPADALMVRVWNPHAAEHPDAVEQSSQALLRAGIARRDILVRGGVLFARVWPRSEDTLFRIQGALAQIEGIDYGLTPFVRNCSKLRTQVEQNALQLASLRAQAMAAAAHETAGRLIAVSQGEAAYDAACGADEHTPIANLANMQPGTLFPEDDYHVDLNAEFVAAVAAAWKLERAAPETSTKPYSPSDYSDVFLPAHGGPLGTSTASFFPETPADCAARELPLLADAVRNGLLQIDASRAFALVDQDFDFQGQFWLCVPTRERGDRGGRTVMQARVVVVP